MSASGVTSGVMEGGAVSALEESTEFGHSVTAVPAASRSRDQGRAVATTMIGAAVMAGSVSGGVATARAMSGGAAARSVTSGPCLRQSGVARGHASRWG